MPNTVDTINHLALVCRRRRHVSIFLSDPRWRARFAQKFEDSSRNGLSRLQAVGSEILTAAFVAGIVALDDVTLFSARHNLIGRPDRIVKQENMYIPEEWKSSKHISHGHRLQLGAYFILIEERYGVRPPFGFVVLGDGSRVKVMNSHALRTEVLSIAEKIRKRQWQLAVPIPVRPPPNKCRNCGQRVNCAQASG